MRTSRAPSTAAPVVSFIDQPGVPVGVHLGSSTQRAERQRREAVPRALAAFTVIDIAAVIVISGAVAVVRWWR
jgi:hypothetical protein